MITGPASFKQGFLHPADWQWDYLFSLGIRGWVVHLVVVVLTAFAQGPSIQSVQIWLSLMLGLTVLMIGICFAGQRTGVDRAAAGWLHSGITAIVALTWSAGALSFAQANQQSLLLYTLALGGTALGAVSSQHAVLRSCLTSIWLSIPGLAWGHWLQESDGQGLANAAMVILFGLVLSMLAFRMSRFLETNHTLSRSLAAELEQSRRERQRADDANLAKSRFIAYASHDLRQPVHAIGMLTEILKSDHPSPASADTIGQIERSVLTLSRQFQILMDLSAIELGRLEPTPSPVAVRNLLTHVTQQNRQQARNRGCQVIVVGAEAYASTDRAMTEAMVQNLLSNALKYAPGSRIALGIKRRGRHFSIIVLDHGPGMGEGFSQTAFEEFRRADTKMPGMGLGLSLVARYCKAIGLEIALHSQPGTGTLIEISGFKAIPKEESDTSRKPVRNRLSGLRVLLVDDDPDVCRAMERLLDGWGCSVKSMNQPPESLAGTDLVVTDFDLGTGLTAADLIAAAQKTSPPCPVVIMSATPSDRIEGLTQPEASIFLHKPVQPAKLRAAMTALILKHRVQ